MGFGGKVEFMDEEGFGAKQQPQLKEPFARMEPQQKVLHICEHLIGKKGSIFLFV